MDQYFVKILANIVTIDQTSVSRDRAQRESELVIFCRAEPSSVSPGCRPLVYSCVEGEGALMGPTSQQTLWPATRVNSDEIIAKCPVFNPPSSSVYRTSVSILHQCVSGSEWEHSIVMSQIDICISVYSPLAGRSVAPASAWPSIPRL